MIEEVRIANLGVIARANVRFGDGLNVLTGETGAGKTMVLSSLELLLGRRADKATVRRGAERAEVDGVFRVDGAVASRVQDLGGSVEDGELIVSRTVQAQGRSRAHLGGRPVPASVLEGLGDSLVTIHGQSDQVRLRSAATQRQALDSFGGVPHARLFAAYAAAWERAVRANRRLAEARGDAGRRAREIADLREITDRIAKLDLHPGEEDELVGEIERLANVEELRDAAAGARAILAGDEEHPGAADALESARESLRRAESLDRSLGELADRLQAAATDVETLAQDLAGYVEGLQADPERLSALHARRAEIHAVLRGRAASIAELQGWQRNALRRLAELEQEEGDPAQLQRELEDAQRGVLGAGEALSRSRAALAARLSSRVTRELQELAMRGARLTVRLHTRKPGPNGLEDVAMELQPHPQMPARPLGQGASGGELSRLMLALEVTLSGAAPARTFLFDEVDAGIGGRAASAVGARLARLARTHQVIVVTHLAQVAAYADHHVVVARSGPTTTVRSVEGDARLAELARMMGGRDDSATARRHAEELIEAASVRD